MSHSPPSSPNDNMTMCVRGEDWVSGKDSTKLHPSLCTTNLAPPRTKTTKLYLDVFLRLTGTDLRYEI